MREGHRAEGEAQVGAGEDVGREAEGAADDEGEVGAAVDGEALEVGGEVFGRELAAAEVEGDDVLPRTQRGEQARPLAGDELRLLGGRKRVGRLLVGHLDHLHGDIAPQALAVLGRRLRPIRLAQFPHRQHRDTHGA
jgi:hypothetical protein